jgi:hypothetical protein
MMPIVLGTAGGVAPLAAMPPLRTNWLGPLERP